MMDLPLYDSGQIPKPRDEVRIEEVETVVYPDRFRLYIHIVVTPFLERPNLLIIARDAENRVVAELSIIETMHHDMEFTMHLRNLTEPAGEYSLTIDLYYETRNPPHDRRVELFTVPEAAE
jgi:hypothetical protein